MCVCVYIRVRCTVCVLVYIGTNVCVRVRKIGKCHMSSGGVGGGGRPREATLSRVPAAATVDRPVRRPDTPENPICTHVPAADHY